MEYHPQVSPVEAPSSPSRALKAVPTPRRSSPPFAPPREPPTLTFGRPAPHHEARDLIHRWLQAGGGVLALESLVTRALEQRVEDCAQFLDRLANANEQEESTLGNAVALRWATSRLRRTAQR